MSESKIPSLGGSGLVGVSCEERFKITDSMSSGSDSSKLRKSDVKTVKKKVSSRKVAQKYIYPQQTQTQNETLSDKTSSRSSEQSSSDENSLPRAEKKNKDSFSTLSRIRKPFGTLRKKSKYLFRQNPSAEASSSKKLSARSYGGSTTRLPFPAIPPEVASRFRIELQGSVTSLDKISLGIESSADKGACSVHSVQKNTLESLTENTLSGRVEGGLQSYDQDSLYERISLTSVSGVPGGSVVCSSPREALSVGSDTESIYDDIVVSYRPPVSVSSDSDSVYDDIVVTPRTTANVSSDSDSVYDDIVVTPRTAANVSSDSDSVYDDIVVSPRTTASVSSDSDAVYNNIVSSSKEEDPDAGYEQVDDALSRYRESVLVEGSEIFAGPVCDPISSRLALRRNVFSAPSILLNEHSLDEGIFEVISELAGEEPNESYETPVSTQSQTYDHLEPAQPNCLTFHFPSFLNDYVPFKESKAVIRQARAWFKSSEPEAISNCLSMYFIELCSQGIHSEDALQCVVQLAIIGKSKCFSLHSVDLSNKNLSCLSRLDKVSMLILENCKIDSLDNVPFSSLTSLKYLRVGSNFIDSISDSVVSALKSLVCLNLTNNNLETLSAASLNQFKSLEYLDISHNPIKGLKESDLHLPRLEDLYVSNTEMSDFDIKLLKKTCKRVKKIVT